MIPTTIVTGALGSGKTTIILNLVKQLPPSHKTIWLKNEYGDVNIDSELARSANIQTQEILNGCVCCVLVGRLHDALVEITETYNPDRLIIETAGTAYPFPIVEQVTSVKKLKLDGLISVIDALNFDMFKDKSPMAKQQSKYIDLIVVNKTNLVEPEQLTKVMDEVYEVYPLTPKISTPDGVIDSSIAFGLDPKIIDQTLFDSEHHHHSDEVEVFSFNLPDISYSKTEVTSFLHSLDSSDYYRIKGIINLESGPEVLNYVLGKVDWQPLKYQGESKITVMGRGILGFKQKFYEKITATVGTTS